MMTFLTVVLGTSKNYNMSMASLYVHETRRSDGERYPLSTILLLLSGILRHALA